MDCSPFTRLTVFLLFLPAVTSVPTPQPNTTTAVVGTTSDQVHQQTVVTAAPAGSTPGSHPLVTNPSDEQANRSTSTTGNDSRDNEAPTSSSPPLSTTATSTAQAQRPATTSQDTSTEPVDTQTDTSPSYVTSPNGPVEPHTDTSPSYVTSPNEPVEPHTDTSPTQSPTNSSLVTLAFGVMSLIIILILIMVVLVTVVHLRDRCSNSTEEGKKSSDSVVSESNFTSNGEKESITLVYMKSINSETDTDSPQVSSIHSTILDYDEHELSRDPMDTKLVGK